MGVKDWFRRLVPFHRRNLLLEHEREQAIQDAIDICRKARLKAPDSHNFAVTDAVFDDLLDAYEKYGLDPAEVWWAADAVFSDNPRWLEALAARALADKSTDRVTLQILRRQSERDPENLPLLLRLIDCYRATGDEYMQAHVSAQALRLATAFRKKSARSLPRGVTHELCDALIDELGQNLAYMYLAMDRDDDEALELYVHAIERDVTQTDFLGVVSRKFMADGRTDAKAIEVYEEAVAFDPDNRALRHFLARVYLDHDRPEEGVTILRGLLQASPLDPEIRETLVDFLALHREHWIPGDLDLLVAHLNSHPDAADLIKTLAEHFLASEDLGDQAIDIYRRAVAQGIDRARCLRLLARHHAERDEWKQVVDHLEQVARIEGSYTSDVVVPLATAYSSIGRADDNVIPIYEAAVEAGSRAGPIHDTLSRYLYLNKRQDPDAIQQFRQTIEIFPDCKWAALGLLQEHLRSGNYSLAFEEAIAVLKREPGEREILHLVARALAHEPNPRFLAQIHELGDNSAREVLRLAHHEKPSAKRIALTLARSEIRTGSREARLIPVLRTALLAEPEDPEIARALSETLWRSGREAEGAEIDLQMLGWIPSARVGARAGSDDTLDERLIAARQAAMRLSGYYARQGKTSSQAIEVLWKAYDLGVCADEAIVFLARHLATAADNRGRCDQQLLIRAVQLQPHDSVLRLALLRDKASRGDVREPLRWCLEQLRASPGRRVVRELLREVINSSGKEDLGNAVLGQLRGLCSAHPDDRELAEIAARAHQIANVMNPQVRAIFETALNGESEDPRLLANLARSYFDAGEDTKAAELYSTLLDHQPDHQEAQVKLAKLYARLHRRTPDALSLVARARSHDKDDVDLGLFHAELLLESEKTEEGMAILEDILNRTPARSGDVLAVAERHRHLAEDSPRGLLLLARVYIQAGEPDDALHMLDTLQLVGEVPINDLESIYDDLVENFPEHVRARMERAVLHKVAGRYEEALADFEALVAEEGPTPAILAEQAEVLQLLLQEDREPSLESLRKLAGLHEMAGETEEAVKIFRRILERAPDDVEIRRALARASLELDRLDEAVDQLRRCPPHLEVAHCLSDAARAFERKSQWGKAVDTLRLALETGHATAEDQVRLSRLEQRVRQEKAAQSARSVIQELPDRAQERYELLQQIAVSEDDAIYRAYDRKMDEVVALKVLPPDFPEEAEDIKLFFARAEALKAFSHPQVVRVLDIGRDIPRRYIAMEYLTGGDLAAKIRRVRGPLSIPEVRKLALDLAETLHAAHEAGLVHGALGPGKILYNIDGKIKITGFVPGPQSPWIGHGAEKGATGQAPFRSPQMRKGASPTAADDIYAFGALLYSVVSGKTPEVEAGAGDPARSELAAPIRRAGPALSRVILRSLAPTTEERYSSFQEVLEALQAT